MQAVLDLDFILRAGIGSGLEKNTSNSNQNTRQNIVPCTHPNHRSKAHRVKQCGIIPHTECRNQLFIDT